MNRPRLLDLFCGAGGAAMGYHRAGFDVVGVDIVDHPNYPYELIIEDITAAGYQFLAMVTAFESYDVIHASPPCQAYTTMANRKRGDHPDLLESIQRRLRAWADATGGIYVIENVPGARSRMWEPLLLHGGMFGLEVDRPRLFETNAPVMVYDAPRTFDPIGVYGRRHDGRRLFTRTDGSTQRAAKSLKQAQAAMGIDWMTWDELAQAIPPAYTEYIGAQLLDHLRAGAT
jgi:DNA (cytosine-5)-methyltransferase 1